MAIAQAIGAALSVGGGIIAAKGQKDAGEAAAFEELRESQLKDLQAAQLRLSSRRQQRLLGIEGERIKGEIRSTFGEGNVETPLALLEQVASDVQEERAAIEDKTEFEVFQLGEESEAGRRSARSTIEATKKQVLGTILGSAGSFGQSISGAAGTGRGGGSVSRGRR